MWDSKGCGVKRLQDKTLGPKIRTSEDPTLTISKRSTIGNNSLILHIYIIIRKHYHTYFELIHAFYIWFWNNVE